MEFDDLIAHFKLTREKLAETPIPVLPPHLLCFDDDGVVCSITAPKPTAQVIAGLLAILPVLRPPTMFLVLELFVREYATNIPIGEDPAATPALAMFHVERDGIAQTRIEAFQVADDGSLTWMDAYKQTLPITVRMLEAIRQMETAKITNSVKEVANWFSLNNYAVRLHPKLLDD